MSQRITLLILLWALPGYGMVKLEKGEHLLRGYYLKNGPTAQLILNKDTRAMDVVDLADKAPHPATTHKSGTKIEVCVRIRSAKVNPNYKGEIVNLRPLGPAEPVIFYSGSLKGCPENMGCQNFARPFKGPVFGDVMMKDLPPDYLSCKQNQD